MIPGCSRVSATGKSGQLDQVTSVFKDRVFVFERGKVVKEPFTEAYGMCVAVFCCCQDAKSSRLAQGLYVLLDLSEDCISLWGPQHKKDMSLFEWTRGGCQG